MGRDPVEILLLDTHAWIWRVSSGDSTLSPSATKAIRNAESAGNLAISAISIWEVAMLEAKGRIQLQKDCLDWVNESISRAGLRVVPVSPEVSVASTRLPGELHGDPADRIIVATARNENAVLVTRDGPLLDYASRGFVRAIEA